MKELVSVVIPCYNAEKYLVDAITSVMHQDYPNIEIIVVDDGSTDRSADVAKRYPVRLIRLQQNRGECYASDIGFVSAEGKYICRLSADDMFVMDDHISTQVEFMENGGYDWCCNRVNLSGSSLLGCDVVRSKWLPIIPDEITMRFPNLCYLLLGIRNPINSSAMMTRAESFYEYHLKHDNIYGTISWMPPNRQWSICDGWAISQMLKHGFKGGVINYPGCFYRIHSNQATGTAPANKDLHEMRKQFYIDGSKPPFPFWARAISKAMLSRMKS